jgi:hypothetical protein
MSTSRREFLQSTTAVANISASLSGAAPRPPLRQLGKAGERVPPSSLSTRPKWSNWRGPFPPVTKLRWSSSSATSWTPDPALPGSVVSLCKEMQRCRDEIF